MTPAFSFIGATKVIAKLITNHKTIDIGRLATHMLFAEGYFGLFYFENSIKKMQSHVNIGTGIDLTIKELAHTIKQVVGYKGRIIFDITKPDGSPRKLLNVDLIKNLGWKAQTKLIDGLNSSYHDYLLSNIT